MWHLALAALFQAGRMVGVGAEVSGTLSESSAPAPGGRPGEVYGFQCVSGLAIQLDVLSGWDNLALIAAPDGRIVAQDDDSGGQNNARITWTCPDNQLYRIAVESYHAGTGGTFQLRVSSAATAGGESRLPGGDRITSTVGLESEVRGSLGPDAARYAGHPIVFYGVRCRTGQVLGIDATSQFDNLLYLFGASGEVARNDDANGTSARLIYTCPDDGRYRIGVAAQHQESTGPFRLNVRNLSLPNGPAAARPARPPAGAPLLFPGARVDGSLTSDAERFQNRPAAWFSLQCQARLPLRIDVTSSWDNVAWVLGPSAVVALNDDAGGTTNARIDWTCPDDGIYRIVVGAANPAQAGDFSLSVLPSGPGRVVTGPAAGPVIVGTLYSGAAIQGNLLALAPLRGGRPTDLYALQCSPGFVVQLTMTSRFDNYLTLEDGAGRVLASNDDTHGTGAALEWTCPDAAVYRVGASARSSGANGRYRLSMR